MNIDDPKLTAYALGELSAEERQAIEKVLQNDPEARAFVAETAAFAEMLGKEFHEEIPPAALAETQRAEIVNEAATSSKVVRFPLHRIVWAAGIGAAAAALAIAAVLSWRKEASNQMALAKRDEPEKVIVATARPTDMLALSKQKAEAADGKQFGDFDDRKLAMAPAAPAAPAPLPIGSDKLAAADSSKNWNRPDSAPAPEPLVAYDKPTSPENSLPVTKKGAGNLIHFGATSITGTLTVTGGSLVMTGSSSADKAGEAGFYGGASATVTLSGARKEGGALLAPETQLLFGLNAPFAPDRSLAKAGTGGWVLNSANSYTGATTINAGTLSINSEATVVNGGDLVTANGSAAVTAGERFAGGKANEIVEQAKPQEATGAIVALRDANGSAADLPAAAAMPAPAATPVPVTVAVTGGMSEAYPASLKPSRRLRSEAQIATGSSGSTAMAEKQSVASRENKDNESSNLAYSQQGKAKANSSEAKDSSRSDASASLQKVIKPAEFKVFASIERSGRSVQLTMPKEGIRYQLTLNGRDLGISEYGQKLLLAEHDRLQLTEKHSYLIVSPFFKDHSAGLSVTSVENWPSKDQNISNITVDLD